MSSSEAKVRASPSTRAWVRELPGCTEYEGRKNAFGCEHTTRRRGFKPSKKRLARQGCERQEPTVGQREPSQRALSEPAAADQAGR
jgi:hypothetical protein